MALRWGVVSAGKISHDFVSAVQTLPKSDHEIVAVAARSFPSAEAFAKSHGIPTAHESYATLAEDKTIDVAYIGTLNPQHFATARLMLEHGKHVLCEKPLTLNRKQTEELVRIARKNKLFLMEAIWSRAFPAYHELRRILDSGRLGEILQVKADFGFDLQQVDRLSSKSLGGGTILDLGIYVLQFQQFVFKELKPELVVAVGQLNDEGVDESMNAIISYANGKVASVSTSARAEYPNEAVVVGTKGIVRIPQFWCPTSLVTPEETLKFELPKSGATFNFGNSVGLAYEAEHVRQCIASQKLESPLVSHEDSIQLAGLMDTLRQQIGVVFPEDL